jgi:hypothetical protein
MALPPPRKPSPLALGQRGILTNYGCVTYVADKRFLLLLMVLDDAVEPLYYERRLSFYADRQNYLRPLVRAQHPVVKELLAALGKQRVGDGLLAAHPPFQPLPKRGRVTCRLLEFMFYWPCGPIRCPGR